MQNAKRDATTASDQKAPHPKDAAQGSSAQVADAADAVTLQGCCLTCLLNAVDKTGYRCRPAAAHAALPCCF